MTALKGRLGNQSGVYIPLLAVISLVVLFIMITFGIDSSTVRQASKALEQFTEQTCREVTARSTIQRQAVESFARQINAAVANNLVRNVKLTRAALVIPTAPIDGTFGFSGEVPVPTPYVTSPTPLPGLEPGISFADMDVLACAINCEGGDCTDCRFYGDVSAVHDLPDTMWDNLRNVGVSSGCLVKGKIKTVLSGEYEISARTAWSNQLRGSFTPVPASITSNDIPNLPALTMLVAPELQTRLTDPRFRFSSQVSGRDYGTEFRAAYDPLYRYAEGNSPGVNAFAIRAPAGSYPLQLPSPYPTTPAPPTFTATPDTISTATNTPTFSPPTKTPTVGPSPTPTLTPTVGIKAALPISAECRSSLDGDSNCGDPDDLPDQERQIPSSAEYADLGDCQTFVGIPEPGVNCLIPSDREEMLAACMNPAILVRNSLTALIAEFAMRHGELRNMFRLLLVNPSSRESSNAQSTMPVEVIPFGADLASKEFQIPYVFFNAGSQTNPPLSSEEPHKFGVINPFNYHQVPDTLPNGAIRNYHILAANQLRWCYHMYYGYSHGFEQALDRYDISDPDLQNTKFEPDNNNEPYHYESSLRNSPYPLGNDSWPQECAWGDFSACSYTRTRGMNAPELLSSLGSVQLCPYEMGGLPNPPFPQIGPTPAATGNNFGVCKKPTNAKDDLRGDLLGSLCHLIGESASSGVCSAQRRAIVSPGIFVMRDASVANPEFSTVAAQSAYTQAENLSSSILLITHQALTASERDEIRDLIDEGHFDKRPITVVFIQSDGDPSFDPAHKNKQYLAQIIEDFRKAFHVPEQFDPSQPISTDHRDSALIVFSPYLESFNCQAATKSECFAQYWRHILVGSGEGSVEVIARNIFFRRILNLELKF